MIGSEKDCVILVVQDFMKNVKTLFVYNFFTDATELKFQGTKGEILENFHIGAKFAIK